MKQENVICHNSTTTTFDSRCSFLFFFLAVLLLICNCKFRGREIRNIHAFTQKTCFLSNVFFILVDFCWLAVDRRMSYNTYEIQLSIESIFICNLTWTEWEIQYLRKWNVPRSTFAVFQCLQHRRDNKNETTTKNTGIWLNWQCGQLCFQKNVKHSTNLSQQHTSEHNIHSKLC